VGLRAPALEASNLYRFFHTGDEEVLALRGVSLTVEAGEMVAVTGPSGSGKSTLLACLAGLDDPDGGIVRVAGTRLSRRPERERAAIRLRAIGILYQSGNLLDHLTVRQNVELLQRLRGGRPRRGVEELLEMMELQPRAAARPSHLSGGESARAGLAVAMANDPPVLLADEPTGEIDSALEDRLLARLRAVVEGGTAVVVVTHSASVAGRADRSIGLEDGRVTA
jgi:putative ABC transport system ATP-binding protein